MSSDDRREVARDLYLNRGSGAAAHRASVNDQNAAFRLIDVIMQGLELRAGQVVVDVACGSGRHLAELAARVGADGRAVGVDFAPDGIEACKLQGLEAYVSDAARLPLGSDIADALCCNYAIYYLDDVGAALGEFLRVLKPGGRLLITGPDHGNNADLYALHRQLTGAEPSDADTLANGFVRDTVTPAASLAGFSGVQVVTRANPITFGGGTFVDYWRNTSLFARTVQDVEGAVARAQQQLGDAAVVVTKQVAVLTASSLA